MEPEKHKCEHMLLIFYIFNVAQAEKNETTIEKNIVYLFQNHITLLSMLKWIKYKNCGNHLSKFKHIPMIDFLIFQSENIDRKSLKMIRDVAKVESWKKYPGRWQILPYYFQEYNIDNINMSITASTFGLQKMAGEINFVFAIVI